MPETMRRGKLMLLARGRTNNAANVPDGDEVTGCVFGIHRFQYQERRSSSSGYMSPVEFERQAMLP